MAVVAVQDVACIHTVSILSSFVHLFRYLGEDDKIDLKCSVIGSSLQRFKEDF